MAAVCVCCLVLLFLTDVLGELLRSVPRSAGFTLSLYLTSQIPRGAKSAREKDAHMFYDGNFNTQKESTTTLHNFE